ncbi:MAG: glycosyltransferase [Pseudomonadota bacterium]
MILVTVGMQLGFDRLIKAMDGLAPMLGMEVVAQTGKGTYQPVNMTAHDRIAPAEFEALVKDCSLIVSHAGIGTILTAQRLGKPIVIVPRRLEYGEHRNDHQIATARNLEGRNGLLIALDESELSDRIAQGLEITDTRAERSPTARTLHDAVTQFIETGHL